MIGLQPVVTYSPVALHPSHGPQKNRIPHLDPPMSLSIEPLLSALVKPFGYVGLRKN